MSDFLEQAQAHIEKMKRAAEELTEALELSPETKYDVLSMMYNQEAHQLDIGQSNEVEAKKNLIIVEGSANHFHFLEGQSHSETWLVRGSRYPVNTKTKNPDVLIIEALVALVYAPDWAKTRKVLMTRQALLLTDRALELTRFAITQLYLEQETADAQIWEQYEGLILLARKFGVTKALHLLT